jgi:hypothetical protein
MKGLVATVCASIRATNAGEMMSPDDTRMSRGWRVPCWHGMVGKVGGW